MNNNDNRNFYQINCEDNLNCNDDNYTHYDNNSNNNDNSNNNNYNNNNCNDENKIADDDGSYKKAKNKAVTEGMIANQYNHFDYINSYEVNIIQRIVILKK